MDFDAIFSAYYTLYRVEAETPASTDDEYTVAKALANEAVSYWGNYDNTYWRELFTTTVLAGEGTTVATGVQEYDVPDDYREAGGHVRILDSNSKTVQTYPIIEPHEAQFKADNATYAYFYNNPSEGYLLRLNPAPSSTLNGKTIQYDYYKSPTLYTTGTDVSEVPDPYFVVHRMLAMRFRGSRNPYYDTALRDAENAIRVMKMRNDSGNWSHPWRVADVSGTSWGE